MTGEQPSSACHWHWQPEGPGSPRPRAGQQEEQFKNSKPEPPPEPASEGPEPELSVRPSASARVSLEPEAEAASEESEGTGLTAPQALTPHWQAALSQAHTVKDARYNGELPVVVQRPLSVFHWQVQVVAVTVPVNVFKLESRDHRGYKNSKPPEPELRKAPGTGGLAGPLHWRGHGRQVERGAVGTVAAAKARNQYWQGWVQTQPSHEKRAS